MTAIMADPILLSSVERSLGQSGASDLALFGAQTDPIVAFAEADPSIPASDLLGSTGVVAPAPGSSGSALRPGDLPDASSGAFAPAAASLVAPTISPASTNSASDPAQRADIAAEPTGSSTAPSILSQGNQPSPTANDLALAQPAETMTAPDLAATTAAAAGLISIASPAVQSLPESVEASAAALGAVEGVSNVIDGLATPAAAALSDAAVGLVQTSSAAATDATADVVAAATGPLMTLAPAASAVVDDALDLLGPDPAGGVATLVSLVTAADMFELGDAAPDGTITAADDLLDSLVIDTPLPDALLGDADGADSDAPPIPPLDAGPIDLPFG